MPAYVNRRVWPCQRLRLSQHLRKFKVIAMKCGGIGCPEFHHGCQVFVTPAPTVCKWNAERLMLFAQPPNADTKVEPAFT